MAYLREIIWPLLLIIPLVQGWWWFKEDSDEDDDPQDDPIPEFDCSVAENSKNVLKISVRNVDVTKTICQANLDYRGKDDAEESMKVELCNQLGSDVCPNCAENPSYTTAIRSVDIRCEEAEESTATAMPTTILSETETQTVSRETTTTTASTSLLMTDSYTGNDLQPTAKITATFFEQEVSSVVNAGLGTTGIIAIVAGVVIILLMIATALCIRKRSKKRRLIGNKGVFPRQNDTEIVRAEADASGDLYTVVQKKKDVIAETVENVLYGSVKTEENTENNDVYAQIDKKKVKTGNN